MPRNPRLAAMRTRRKQKEDEIAAPHKEAALRHAQRADAECRAREALERIMGNKLATAIMDRIAHRMTEGVRKVIFEAITKARRATGVPGMISIEIHEDELRFLDPDSLERRVLERWKRDTMHRARFHAVTNARGAIANDTTVLDVRVPELGYREHILDMQETPTGTD